MGQSNQPQTTDQDKIIAFLESGDAFGGQEVERIDTHMSHVFLTGDRAYKMKRAIHFNFVDFSTLELRTAACEHELEINRHWAPDLYLDLVPVTERSDGTLCLGGDGTVLEWLVEMRRFDQEELFDVLARQGALTGTHMDDLGDRIANSHAAVPQTPDFGTIEHVKQTAAEILVTFLEAKDPPVDRAAAKALDSGLQTAIAAHGDLIDARRQAGYTRHCHGDLHLGNICLHDGRATPFDSIEFSEEMPSTDVLYDIAFPVMDLIAHDLPDLGNRLLNRYLHATRDYGGLSLLRMFLSMRAAVRAKVLLLSAKTQHGNDPKIVEAVRYFHLAERLLEASPPRFFTIGGLSGTGKSTIARQLALDAAPAPGAIVLHSDMMRKRLAGVAPETRLGDAGYTPEMNEKVYRTLNDYAVQALKADLSVIIDATFLEAANRDAVTGIARQAGVPYTGLWLDAPADVLRARVGRRDRDMSDADLRILELQLGKSPIETDWIQIDCSGSQEETYNLVRQALFD